MAKISLTRKSITIIVVIAVLLFMGGAAAGVWYGLEKRDLEVGIPQVDAIFAEPDYSVRISWNEVKRAESYAVEYVYDSFDNEVIHRIEDVKATSVMVARKRGILKFRVLAFGRYSFGASEWQTYYVEPLRLAELPRFSFDYVSGKTYRLNAETFVPVTYNYKGQTYTINYYEVRITYPNGITDSNPVTVSYSEISSEGGWKLNFAVGGDYEIELRPVLYVDINGVKDYDVLGINELYEPNTRYTKVTLTV